MKQKGNTKVIHWKWMSKIFSCWTLIDEQHENVCNDFDHTQSFATQYTKL